MSRRRQGPSRRGVALVTTLMVLVALTILVTAAAARASAERGTSDDERAQLAAYAAARSGLEHAQQDLAVMLPSALGMSWERQYTGFAGNSRAEVRVERLADETAPSGVLYLLTSTGVVPSGGADIRVPPARRSISQLVTRGSFRLTPPAALVALGGVHSTDVASRFDGNDACTVSPPKPPLPGVGVPLPLATGPGGFDVAASAVAVQGMPSGSAAALTSSAMSGVLDWSGVVNGTRFSSSFLLSADGAYLSSAPSAGDRYAVSRRTGNLLIGAASSSALTSPQPGTLVVTGDLVIEQDWSFDGLVLVGGALRVDTGVTVQVRGGLWTGLAAIVGASVTPTDLLGRTGVRFDHCVLDSIAVRQGSGLGRITSTTYDAAPVP